MDSPRHKALWPWALVIVGLIGLVVFGYQAFGAYQVIVGIDAAANVQTTPMFAVFTGLIVNGVDVAPTVAANSRIPYRIALEQMVLFGTGACLAFIVSFFGLFIVANQ